jgi:hypothetical protein
MLLAILGLCGAPAAFSSAAVGYGERFATRTFKALGSTGGAFLTALSATNTAAYRFAPERPLAGSCRG